MIQQLSRTRWGRIAAPGVAAVALAIVALLAAFDRQEVRGQVSSDIDLQQDPFPAADVEFFEREVRPLLVAHCYECHAGDEFAGGLSLESRAGLLRGGDSGPALVPGEPDSSLLIDAVNHRGAYEMPPDEKLSQTQVDLLTEWVRRGAPWTADDVERKARQQTEFDIASRLGSHWCWQPVSRPTVPQVAGFEINDALDAFVAQRLRGAGLTFADRADRLTLIRRLYFDLIGLPPPPDLMQRAAGDPDAVSIESVVDSLLASPRFGERWARHWLDLVRYAETCGHEFDFPLPDAFEYRDYLIRAFNADVPYNQLIREHLAGDLIHPPRVHPEEEFNESILGTGFWFLGEAVHSPVDVLADQAARINNQLDVASKTFLGLTVACARCHDHKFDAISTKDYYALSGYLLSSNRQRAMLDPGGKIHDARSSLDRVLDGEVHTSLQAWGKNLSTDGSSRLAKYLQASLQFLAEHHPPDTPKIIRFEAASLRVAKQPMSGNLSVSTSLRQDPTDRGTAPVLNWNDVASGEGLALEFEVAEAGEFDLEIECETNIPIEAVRFELDGLDLKVDREDSDPALDWRDTEWLTLTTGRLDAGKHLLALNIEHVGGDAERPEFIGLANIRLTPAKVVVERQAWHQSIAAFADSVDCQAATLQRTIDAILANELHEDPKHPLHWIARLARLTSDDRATYIEELNGLIERGQQVELVKRQLFEDFAEHPAGWKASGEAFDLTRVAATRMLPWASVRRAGVVTSRAFGDQFQGVLFSPTFEITQPFIHYRLRGKDCQVRVIVDGYVMDVYNALLFNGMTLTPEDDRDFHWLTQSGDLANYIGHQAHLEFVDMGGGWIEIDEIWFSQAAQPPTALPELSQAIESESALCDNAASAVCAALARMADNSTSLTESESMAVEWVWKALLEGALVPLADETIHGIGLPFSAAISHPVHDVVDQRRDIIDHCVGACGRYSIPQPRYALAIADGSPTNAQVYVRGNHKVPGDSVNRGDLTALLLTQPENPSAQRPSDLQGSGRLELADRWASDCNPLAARVAVNRVWHHLFGTGIVKTVDDFGVMGEPPTHPELLDYLAAEFVEHRWSMKQLIRRIVLSRTYQQSAMPLGDAGRVDPENRRMHSHAVRRLDGEAIRDSLLALAGTLDTRQGGPSVPVYLTPFMEGRGRPGNSGPLDGEGRRSIYLEVRRNFLNPVMLAFDTPIPFNTVGRRNNSNVPAQALIMMNDPLVADCAQQWARRLLSTDGSFEERIRQMYWEGLGRLPSKEEVQACEAFVLRRAEALQVDLQMAYASPDFFGALCHVLINTKEFIFIR